MRRCILLACLAALAGCMAPGQTPINETYVVQPNTVCRIGPDDGPPAGGPPAGGLPPAERGSGGTGGPSAAPAVAAPAFAAPAFAERGIGGTGIQRMGIVGVVTGFASICVDGLDVQYDPSAGVEIDGAAATADHLRAGQIVIIEASDAPSVPAAMPMALRISARTEVTGPVEGFEPDSRAMMIAGQRVLVTPATWGADTLRLGDWVTVSGLRQPDHTIVASRVDPGSGKPLAVRGPVTRDGSSIRIGGLLLQGADVAALAPGQPVSISGTYAAGAAMVTAIEVDRLSADPTAYFGNAVGRIVLQAFARVERGAVLLNDGRRFAVAPSVKLSATRNGDAIIVLERQADGAFLATEVRFTDFRGQGKPLSVSSGNPDDTAVSRLGGADQSTLSGISATNRNTPPAALMQSARASADGGAETELPPRSTSPVTCAGSCQSMVSADAARVEAIVQSSAGRLKSAAD